MTTILAGVTLPEPVLCDVTPRPSGSEYPAGDNSYRYIYAGPRPYWLQWSVRWEGMTYAQKGLIKSAWDQASRAAVQWRPPRESATYMACAKIDLSITSPLSDDAYSVSFTLEEN